MKIYIVKAQYGHWSELNIYDVAAYLDRELADQHVEFAGDAAAALYNQYGRYDSLPGPFNSCDNFIATGSDQWMKIRADNYLDQNVYFYELTTYSVVELELNERLPTNNTVSPR